MNTIKTDESYKYWDKVAGWSKAETSTKSPLIKCINNKFGIHIMPNDIVLDFGCGTGIITLKVAEKANKVYGVDISEEMLKRAQKNLINQNINNTTFTKVTTLNKMFKDNFFHVITIFNVLQYVENRKELFKQLYKLLKPNGLIIIAVPCFDETNIYFSLYIKFLRVAHIMPKTYFFSANEIEKEITDAGLTIIESINLSDLPERYMVGRKME